MGTKESNLTNSNIIQANLIINVASSTIKQKYSTRVYEGYKTKGMNK
jgi:hypothetical protein